jgi:hypothetical protein
MFKKLLRNRKGTAEIVGTVLFLIIMMFFFTNVYLFRDIAVQERDNFMTQKMNSPISIYYEKDSGVLMVTNTGGVDTALSRLWIMKSGEEPRYILLGDVAVAAGASRLLDYNPQSGERVKVITEFGNSAALTIP